MKERDYIAQYDDGHDYGVLFFTSTHRAGSKANLDDARAQACKKYGHRRASQIHIYKIALW